MKNAARLTLLLAALACAPGATTPTTGPAPASGTRETPTDQPWPIRTREHVDLWLHGFAMLEEDTALVPHFKRGYRDRAITARNAANVRTLLDTNRDRLRARFAQNRMLSNAQFLALYFRNGDDLRQAISLFLQARGDPRAVGQNRDVAMVIALMAQSFPSPADHDWLRMFWESLQDESSRFYHDHWIAEQRTRAPTLAAVDSLWQRVHRPALERFLRNTQQANGSIVLSLPLNGEGRTILIGNDLTLTAVTFPDRPADAIEAIFVTIHELVAKVTGPAIEDNVTPAELREQGARLQAAAAVRGGAMLLQRVNPALADDYARYYLRAANRPAGTNPLAALATTFPLPVTVRDAIGRQLDLVLGGI